VSIVSSLIYFVMLSETVTGTTGAGTEASNVLLTVAESTSADAGSTGTSTVT